jgi:hypothetical protein
MADKPSIHRDKDDPAHDLVLMRRVHDGDESAFRTLYEAHRVHVLNFFHGLSRNHLVSNDLTQETFLRIWKFRERYAATGALKGDAVLLCLLVGILLVVRRRVGVS